MRFSLPPTPFYQKIKYLEFRVSVVCVCVCVWAAQKWDVYTTLVVQRENVLCCTQHSRWKHIFPHSIHLARTVLVRVRSVCVVCWVCVCVGWGINVICPMCSRLQTVHSNTTHILLVYSHFTDPLAKCVLWVFGSQQQQQRWLCVSASSRSSFMYNFSSFFFCFFCFVDAQITSAFVLYFPSLAYRIYRLAVGWSPWAAASWKF